MMDVPITPSLHARLSTVKKGTVNIATIKSFYQLRGLFNSPKILFCAIIAEALRRSRSFRNLINTRFALSAQLYLTNLPRTAQCATNCSAWHAYQGPTVIYFRNQICTFQCWICVGIVEFAADRQAKAQDLVEQVFESKGIKVLAVNLKF